MRVRACVCCYQVMQTNRSLVILTVNKLMSTITNDLKCKHAHKKKKLKENKNSFHKKGLEWKQKTASENQMTKDY